jgi:sulfur carrier protein
MNAPTRTASTLTLHVNGVEERLEAATVAALLAAREVAPGARGIAVAVNGRVISRDAWSITPLRDGDVVEIVRAMQGG